MSINLSSQVDIGFNKIEIQENQGTRKSGIRRLGYETLDVDEEECISSTTPNIKKLDLSVKTKNKSEVVGKTPSTVSNFSLSRIIMESQIIINLNDTLYIWDTIKKHYVPFINEYADKIIRNAIPDKYKNKINNHSIKEILNWIKASDSIPLIKRNDLNNKSFIAFKNGIFDIKTRKLISHNSKYFFTSINNIKYPKKSIQNGEEFENFMSVITNGDSNLYLRIQELFGYVISEIRDVKYIPYFLGPKDTGKSVVLKLLEHLVGEDNYTNIGFEQLNKDEYLAELIGKRLNTCGETSEISLNKLDTLKKLSGNDSLMARSLFGNPIKFINRAVLVFAGNHLPQLKVKDASNAFIQRLLIIPFNNPIAKHHQDICLVDKLIKESKYIANWAIEGLLRWQKNNYQFTNCTTTDEILHNYFRSNNSIECFIQDCCTLDCSSKTYNHILENAYHEYCQNFEIIPSTNKAFHKYLKSLGKLESLRYRQGSENRYGYKGIMINN